MSSSLSQVPVNTVLDQNPEKPQPCCIVCGTWICRECWNFRRPYARYTEPGHHICGRCGGIDGFFLATRHSHWKANKPFFVNGYRHRVLPQTPFEVPKMSISNPWACPAGDPCPGTGCHACCPSYDPCGKAGCNSCKVETVHVPEEADAMTELEECDWVVRVATLETADEYCGLEVERGKEFCPKHQAQADALVEEDPSPATKLQNTLGRIRSAVSQTAEAVTKYPHRDGDSTVIGPECFSPDNSDAIAWKGEWYYRAAKPEASVDNPNKYARREAMHHAVEMRKSFPNAQGLAPRRIAEGTVEIAQKIYEWMTAED